MTDLPYTPEDLRTEAARQHATLAEDPDFMGIGEQMDGAEIDSTFYDADGARTETGTTWDDLAPHEFENAQRAIDTLINGAVDLSDWAVNLGADGLEPDEHQLGFKAGDKPIVRVHFAFDPGLSDEARAALVQGMGEVAAQVMSDALNSR